VTNWLFSDAKPQVHDDKQGKHQPGHKNFIPGRSELTDPKAPARVAKWAQRPWGRPARKNMWTTAG
jgi:hypothetical protein